MQTKDMNRRTLLTAAGATGLGVLATEAVGAQAQSQAQVAQQGQADDEGSGETQSAPPVQDLELDLSKEIEAAPEATVHCFFGRISPDAAPGSNTLTITGLPQGTRCISVWMTEFSLPNNPHAGAAFYYTDSVQLYANGTRCRVIFRLTWSRHLPTACQVLFA